MPVCGSGVMFGAISCRTAFRCCAPAGEVLTAAGQRMARRAIADDGEIAAALDLPEVLFVDAISCGAGRCDDDQRDRTAPQAMLLR